MQLLFRFLSVVMFFMMLAISGLFDKGQISFTVALVMVIVAAGGVIGCSYLGGWWDVEYKEED